MKSKLRTLKVIYEVIGWTTSNQGINSFNPNASFSDLHVLPFFLLFLFSSLFYLSYLLFLVILWRPKKNSGGLNEIKQKQKRIALFTLF